MGGKCKSFDLEKSYNKYVYQKSWGVKIFGAPNFGGSKMFGVNIFGGLNFFVVKIWGGGNIFRSSTFLGSEDPHRR